MYDDNPFPYKASDKIKEEWIVNNIKKEYRNGYREVVGLPINEEDPPVKGTKV